MRQYLEMRERVLVATCDHLATLYAEARQKNLYDLSNALGAAEHHTLNTLREVQAALTYYRRIGS